MNEATIATTIMSAAILAIFLGFLIWALKSGQLKNVEEAKYHVFRSEKRISKDDDKNPGKVENPGQASERKEGI